MSCPGIKSVAGGVRTGSLINISRVNICIWLFLFLWSCYVIFMLQFSTLEPNNPADDQATTVSKIQVGLVMGTDNVIHR